jgi:hypothetical protein
VRSLELERTQDGLDAGMLDVSPHHTLIARRNKYSFELLNLKQKFFNSANMGRSRGSRVVARFTTILSWRLGKKS